ncbi:MAG TPA: lysylphosphatidylglycerol synthase transmembrane domain-containing protein [Bryobacteraceae bacterium]|nr:lysylphosphatidylglycerol synthase transmembrane domain-containing protein [Bryobacteraceae bacterium]
MTKRHAGAALVLAAALTAVAFVVYRWRTTGFAWKEFLATVQSVDGAWLAASIALILATYLGRALRWQVMLYPLAPRARLRWVLASTCIGFTAVVLFGRAGEPVRPYLISRRAGVTFSSQIAAWVLERILDLLMVLLIFGIALMQISDSAVRPGPKVQTFVQAGGAVAGLTGLVCLALLVALRAFRGSMQTRLVEALAFLPDRPRARIERFLTAFGEGMQSTRSSWYAFQLVAYSVLEWALVAGSFYSLFRAIPVTARLSPIDSIIVLGFVCLGSILQIPGVGGGIQLVTVLVLTEFYGLPLEAASGVAVLWWVVCFVSIVPIGLALAFHEGVNWRSLRHIVPPDSTVLPTLNRTA